MAQWTIAPKSGGASNTGASIDNTGKVTFQTHSAESVYTITYTSDTISSAVTKDVTVYACLPCSCSFQANGTLASNAQTSATIGGYSIYNCSNSNVTATFKSGTNFLSNFTFASGGGTIKANVAANTSTASTRSGTYTFKVGGDSCSKDVTFTQSKATPTPPPTGYSFTVYSNVEGATVNIGGTNYTITNGKAVHASTNASAKNVSISKAGYTFNPSTGTVNANSSIRLDGSVTPPPATCNTCAQINVTHEWGTITIPAAASSNYTLAKFTTNCENPNLVAKEVLGTSFAQNLTVERTGANTYRVVGNIIENTSKQFARVQHIAVFLGSSQCGGQVVLNQQPAAGCTCSVTGKTDITYQSVTSILIATYTASCTSNAVVSYVSGAQIIQTPTCTVSGGQIKASVNGNTSINTRTGTYALYFDNVKCAEFSITQVGKVPEPTYSYNITYTNETNVNIRNIGCVVNLSDGNALTYVSTSNIEPGGTYTSTIQRTGNGVITSVAFVYFTSSSHSGNVSSSCYTVSGLGGRNVGIRILCDD